MLVDTAKQNTKQNNGFDPVVQNDPILNEKKYRGVDLLLTILLFLLGLLPGIIYVCYKISIRNWFNRQQMNINEKTSGIDVQLTQRCATLNKLVSSTKDSMKFEKSLLTEIANLRSNAGKGNVVELDKKVSAAYRQVMATFEQYPKVKSLDLVQQLMSSAEFQEQEIAAARRLYNAEVRRFNSELFVWPKKYVATKMQLHTLPLFVASQEERKDVSTKLL